MASQVFDPFGLVQPHALPVKRLMQQLCEMNLGWDDSIPEDLEATWQRWVQALPKLEDITVPRCFIPLENAGSIELHCFSDACETGPAKVACSLEANSFLQAFFRFIHRRGSVSEIFSDNGTNFVMTERELRAGIKRWKQQLIHKSLSQKGVK